MPATRGVIVVSPVEGPHGETMHTFKVEEAFGVPVSAKAKVLACKSTDAEFVVMGRKPPTNTVQEAGKRLYDTLYGSDTVRRLFEQMAQGLNPNPPPGAPSAYPLFVKIDDAPDAEGLPWEVLWETQAKFFCLDQAGRWPVARLVATTTRAAPLFRIIEPGLRVVLVLAAVGEDGSKEWAGFNNALAALPAPAQVLVLVSEDAALQRVQGDLAAWTAPQRRGDVKYIGDTESLLTDIAGFTPNIIHVFCHGTVDPRPELELETRSDRRSRPPKERGSIKLDDALLGDLARLHSLWLVVLNCCRGGKPAPNLHSMAKSLVTAGVPAVVAMRESIAVPDAYEFTKHFYPILFAQLDAVFAPSGPRAPDGAIPFPELAWMRATDGARRQLSQLLGRVAATDSEWTYPVLYMHRDELRLQPRPPSAPFLKPEVKIALQARLEVVRSILEGIRPSADPTTQRLRREAELEILDLEHRLAVG